MSSASRQDGKPALEANVQSGETDLVLRENDDGRFGERHIGSGSSRDTGHPRKSVIFWVGPRCMRTRNIGVDGKEYEVLRVGVGGGKGGSGGSWMEGRRIERRRIVLNGMCSGRDKDDSPVLTGPFLVW